MNIRELKEMLQLMKDHELSEMEIEKEGLKIRLKKASGDTYAISESAGRSVPRNQPGRVGGDALRGVSSAEAAASPKVIEGHLVKSPMVGTFYGAPAPDQPNFVTVGKRIKEGDVLCIIEAMKLMNEIKSDVSGVVEEVFVQNGQAVEFDQSLVRVKRD